MTTLSGSLFAMDVAKKYFSTTEVAKLLGVHRMTIHKWCVRFDIQAKRRTRLNYRMLSVEDVAKLKYIAFMRRAWRMTLSAIGIVVRLNGWPDPERVDNIIQEQHSQSINSIKGII